VLLARRGLIWSLGAIFASQNNMKRIEGIAAARMFVDTYYPDCLAALLFGSVARSESTPSSDLDILIVAGQEIQSYRKSFRDYGWFIEAYVGSQKFNEDKIRRPRANHNPSFLTSWAEGFILKDHDNFAQSLKEEASAILEEGPDNLTQQEMDQYRYVITSWLDDLIDSNSYQEGQFIAYELVAKTAELLLAYDRQWIGERKWLYRALQRSEHRMAKQLMRDLEHFYRTGEKDRLIESIGAILELVGGKLYEGYSKVE
jgi:hypothetical protein